MGCKQSNSYNVEQPESEESEDATRANGTQLLRGNSYVNTGYDGNLSNMQPYDTGLPDSLDKEDHNENVFSAPGHSPMKLQIQDEYPESQVTSPLEEDPRPSSNDNRGSPGDDELAMDECVTKMHHQLESNMDRDVDAPLSVNPARVEHDFTSNVEDAETDNHIHDTTDKVIDEDLASDASSTSSMVVKEDIEHTSLHTTGDEGLHTDEDMQTQIVAEPVKTLSNVGTASLPEIIVELHEDDQDTRDSGAIQHSTHDESDRDSTADSDNQNIVVGMHGDDLEHPDRSDVRHTGHNDSDRDSADVQTKPRDQEVGDDSDDDLQARVTTYLETDKDRDSTHSSELSGNAAEGNLTNVFQDILQYSEEKETVTGYGEHSDDYEKVTGHDGYSDEKGEVTGHDEHSEEKITITGHDEDDTSYNLDKHNRDTGWIDSEMLPPPEGFSDNEVQVLKVT